MKKAKLIKESTYQNKHVECCQNCENVILGEFHYSCMIDNKNVNFTGVCDMYDNVDWGLPVNVVP